MRFNTRTLNGGLTKNLFVELIVQSAHEGYAVI